MNIIKDTGTHNTTASASRKIEYIVIHYTASTNSNTGQAKNVASWFRNPSAGGSADFIVDDSQFVQYNPDPKNRYCWAVGGSKYTSMTTSKGGKYYGKCTNKNSISIEVCSSKTNKKSLGSMDKDWYFTDKVVANAVTLTKYLMKQYNIKADHVIMHHQVTGKVCPAPWTLNEKSLSGWTDFQKKIKDSSTTTTTSSSSSSTAKTTTTTSTSTTKYEVTASSLNIRAGAGASYKVVGSLKKGAKVEVSKTSNGWGYVPDKKGWISLSYAKKVTSTSTTKTTTTSSSSYKATVTATSLNIRKGAGTSYAVVGTYKKGATITITSTKNGWGQTSKGWVSLSYTKKK